MNASDDYSEFEEQVKRIGIEPPLGRWLYSLMQRYGVRRPTINTKVNADPDDLLGCIIEGTIEAGRFRPTVNEANAAVAEHPLKTYVDLGLAIAYICAHGPKINAEVLSLCPDGASMLTRHVWDKLCRLTPNSYNDQFVVRCFLKPQLLPAEHEDARGITGKIANFWRSFRRLNDAGAEPALRGNQYKFHPLTSFSGFAPMPGDVVKFEKKALGDRFTLFAIVTDVEDRSIVQAEFKPDWNSPLKATQVGLELFLLRDAETQFVGYWRRAES